MQGIEDGDGGRYAHSAPAECTASMGARLRERGERGERAAPPQISGIQRKVWKRGSETSELNAVGRINVYTRKGKGREGKRERLISIQRHRAR